MQERVNTGLLDACVAHKPIDQFIINLHGFHNSHLVRMILPRSLTAPIPLFEDRLAKHNELAASLRVSQTNKRAQQKVRQAENKRKREAEKQQSTTHIVNGNDVGDVAGPSGAVIGAPGSSPNKRQRRVK